MQYAQFVSKFKTCRNFGEDELVTVSKNLLLRLLKSALRHKADFDPDYYLDNYADIRNAVSEGSIVDPAEHYYATGYFENRRPRRLTIDERFYLKAYPDVADAMRSGSIASPQAHFDTVGFHEGKMPYADFSLF